MISYATLKEQLARSRFRMRFALNDREVRYVAEKGLQQIREQAQQIIRQRLGDALPRNDGKQTPMRGHPVFIAQHATGCCCRSCLAKWQHIPMGRPLSEQEINATAEVIVQWIREQCQNTKNIEYTPDLFETLYSR